ncbi:MAG: RnfABCDGE type electron transport complex subunit D [Spirochaetales bacterium]|nr:RnfABCDGE type electron transport complex subunit D [Spirochaetales bacterium]
MFSKQDPMRRVLYSLVPIFIWSVYLYGWRVVAVTAVVYLLGILTEFIFEKSRNKKVTEAVLVTCGLLALSLPPAVPLWVAAVAGVFAVLFGKEVYGGFGRNVYNPAITGRTFAYISFPLMMQTTWMIPGNWGLGGMNHQVQGSVLLEAGFMIVLIVALFLVITRNPGNKKLIITSIIVAVALTIAFYVTIAYAFPYIKDHRTALNDVDVVATATPIEIFRGLAQQNNWHQTVNVFGVPVVLENNNVWALFFGIRSGAIGEGPIFLILLAGIYLLWTKTANWRPMIITMVSAAVLTAIFYYTNVLGGTPGHPGRFPELAVKPDLAGQINDILRFMMVGSLLFGAVFMSTDPVSSPKKPVALWLYGIIIGGVTILIRVYAGFPEGISFGILTANTFASLLDEILPAKKKKTVTKSSAKPAVADEGGQA